jgi:hypothetical protein
MEDADKECWIAIIERALREEEKIHRQNTCFSTPTGSHNGHALFISWNPERSGCGR